ncbi:tRNA (adenosine(37)-N6)-threonylcarbamoyltransferase complex ATPase subunit type 1 TsaE [Asticcacaulis machinosus]|uniref:tRNA threonylcarbamoyladenosine biosynthesis protein TsaE n=1 Tax=Asticcacaulis machinosus TaxID=2984211 RepID=A0ABT5HL03_9CAUL|nr:tRNA (adenosine(37)-N6)-threonylcarbamoyltransferase complex ATPase subunit type 1 TsaE [Asticcacaulis machinosus]MDC7676857.1 tRNA (adenosine(37)-N6)-threonylcarbamoyltransferase complex ATPase subunit type 1 TsaE [Asticcacaulis machinosus]
MIAETVWLKDAAATEALGARIGQTLKAGDIIYLTGDLGAGKSCLARGLIRSRTKPDQDVPSPTFTLVQTYEAEGVDIAHFDLYRLTDPEEVYEIGLFELAEDHACLIEWPQRLGHLGFEDYLEIHLEAGQDDAGHQGRIATLTPHGHYK